MKFSNILAVAIMCIMMVVASPVLAASNRTVPPNMIGLILTPTGFDGKIYEPGEYDIGDGTWNWGRSNRMILLQRSGFAIKEQFIGSAGSNDQEDHRCIVGPNREPMTLDARLLFALPDYKTEVGKTAILRMGLLGNPEPAPDDLYGGNRVMILNAESVYVQQVQQQVRGKIRDVCLNYPSVNAVFDAIAKNGTADGFTDTLTKAVGTVLAENDSPLFLVGSVASNVKPDSAVVSAIVANQAADTLIGAMTKISDYIEADPTGTRALIYKMMVVQEMNKNGGNNTMFMTDVGSQPIIPLPQK